MAITRIFSWIVSTVLTLVFLLFVLSNRELVVLSLWPFATTITAPLYLFFLLTLFVAFFMGLTVMWLLQHKHRAEAKRLRRELAAIEAASKPKTEDPASLIAPSIY